MKGVNQKKHVELIETTRNGIPTFRLLCDDKLMAEFFDSWAYKLAKKQKYRTVRTYCYQVCTFLNYIYEVVEQNGDLTTLLLMDAIDSFESYLAFGVDSESEMASNAAKALGSKNLSGSSIETHVAAVNRFIDASEELRKGLMQLEGAGYINNTVTSSLPLTISRYEATTASVKAAIKANSWLAGCISGGYKKIKRAGLKAKAKPSMLAHTDEYGGDEKAFPIDKFRELIDATDCLRDKVLWCMMAASGIRFSEATTMFIGDVAAHNFGEKKLLVIDPDTRRNELKKYLTEGQINRLPHKGRASPETFLIEPFASMLWNYLDQYIQEQRELEKRGRKPVIHPFIIRNLTNGNPMVNSYQSLLERFQAAAMKATKEVYGFHSLRHMYGYYLMNYCPNPNPRSDKPFGLEESIVQSYMGHKDPKSTKRYARLDYKMLEVTMATANMLRMENPFFSVNNVQITHLEQQLEKLKNKQIILQGNRDQTQ